MNLPKKDKNGKNRLSYSQIKTFKKSKADFIKQYILNEKFKGNKYTRFGSKVGRALELGEFDKFSSREIKVLKTATRLNEFERFTILEFDDFNVYGYIDTISTDLSTIIDYKTGGIKKHLQYSLDDYIQLHLYALSIRQETGITPVSARVEFITREGNAYKGQELLVKYEPIKKIYVDISEEKLKKVYYETIEIANEISEFYNQYLKHN